MEKSSKTKRKTKRWKGEEKVVEEERVRRKRFMWKRTIRRKERNKQGSRSR